MKSNTVHICMLYPNGKIQLSDFMQVTLGMAVNVIDSPRGPMLELRGDNYISMNTAAQHLKGRDGASPIAVTTTTSAHIDVYVDDVDHAVEWFRSKQKECSLAPGATNTCIRVYYEFGGYNKPKFRTEILASVTARLEEAMQGNVICDSIFNRNVIETLKSKGKDHA